jgi:uncharacterized protein YndB with AHSA1/START domain
MLKMIDLTVAVTKIINAPIDNVFDAWLDPELLSRFILPMPGMPQPQTEIDAREGGDFTIIMQVGDDKVPHTGTYLEISRPDKLVFTWKSPFSTDGSVVTLMFNAIGDNRTNVDLVHVKFIDEESRANHEGGWGNILECLNTLLS